MTVFSPESLPVLKGVLLLTQLIQFPMIGVLVGGSTLAVFADLLGRRRSVLAADLIRHAGPRNGAFVLLPLVVAAGALCLLLGYGPPLKEAAFWIALMVPLFCGLLLLSLYRRCFESGEQRHSLEPALGLAGIPLVLLSFFLLCSMEGLLIMPEKWPFLKPGLMYLSWSGTARFIEFTLLSLSATGAVVLLLGCRPERQAESFEGIRKGGASMTLFFLLPLPPVMLFGLYNLPGIALSASVYALSAVSLMTSAGTALLLVESFRTDRWRPRAVFVLIMALFLLWILGAHFERENAITELTVTGPIEAPRKVPAVERVPAADEKEKQGQEIFERICSRCHRFDQKLVGPPLNSVLPAYRGDVEALKAFIRQPVKKNPDYPAMPQLGLQEEEIESVARYLLAKVEGTP